MTQSRTTAFGLWRFANDYLDAARLVGAERRHEISAPHYFLLGHGTELALKAFLLAKGFPVMELKRTVSHDLKLALDKSKELGLLQVVEILPDEEHSLILLNQTYQSKQHEYLVTGYRQVPQPALIISLVEKVLKASRQLCLHATIRQVRDVNRRQLIGSP